MANKISGYTVVAYPESLLDGWEYRLNGLPFGYCCALHDKDIRKDEDGNEVQKKSHMHFFFQGRPTPKQKKYIHDCLSVAYGEDVRSMSGMFEYLTHENHPTKYHYSRDIIVYSPKWCQEAFDMHYIPKKDLDGQLMQLIVDNDITEYSMLIEILYELGDEELFAASKKFWIMRYLDSRRNRFRN